MHFNSAQTQHDPEIKYLLTQLEYHTGQVEAARRSLARYETLLAGPRMSYTDSQALRTAQAAAENLIVSNQPQIDGIAAGLTARGVVLTRRQARCVTPADEPVEASK